MTTTQKNDFIEIRFIGKANNEIFDTTDPEEAKKLHIHADVKPLIVSVGNKMVLEGFDEALEHKELNKEYTVQLKPEKAFGKRDPKLIQILPMRAFKEKNMNPIPGATIHLDNHLAKILSVSGGRVTVDLNNPLAGKEIEYTFTITRKITDDTEKVNALQDSFFKQRFEFTIKEKKVFFKEEKLKPMTDMMNERFTKMSGLTFTVEEKKKEPKEKESKKAN